MIHAEACQVFWIRMLTLVSWTPSTSTVLINVPPKWQWCNKVSIPLWQANWWLHNSRHCRARPMRFTLRSWNVKEMRLWAKLGISLQALSKEQPTRFPRRTSCWMNKLPRRWVSRKLLNCTVNRRIIASRNWVPNLVMLSTFINNAGLMSSSVEKSNADLQAARSELAEYRTQIDAMNQHALNMKRLAESQKRDFEVEIEKLRTEQKELIRSLKSQPLEGTPGLEIHYRPGRPNPHTSQPSRPIIEELDAGDGKLKHSSDADDEHFLADPFKPPGLPGGGPPDDDDDDDSNDRRGRKDKKDKKKGCKTSRGRSRRRRRRDPSSSPSSSSSPITSSSDSESSFASKVKRALDKSRTSDSKAKESDRILVPKFPQPENYRNWRIRVRVGWRSVQDGSARWSLEGTQVSLWPSTQSSCLRSPTSGKGTLHGNLTFSRKNRPSRGHQPENVKHCSWSTSILARVGNMVQCTTLRTWWLLP